MRAFFRNMMRAVFLLVGVFAAMLVSAQSLFTLSGTVADSANGESLIGASVSLVDQPGVGAACNEYGFFALRLPAGEHRIRMAMLGYAPLERTVDLMADLRMDFRLQAAATELRTAKVTATRRYDDIHAPRMGVEKLDMKQIAKGPVIFGRRIS